MNNTMNDTPEQIIGALEPEPPANKAPVARTDWLDGFEVEYYEYDCGHACTPNGCCGHLTEIPLAFSVGGVTFHVDGAEQGYFPDDQENTNRVCNVVEALAALIAQRAGCEPPQFPITPTVCLRPGLPQPD